LGLRKNLIVIVGGAPVDSGFAKKIGADYYFEDAFDVRTFIEENFAKMITKKSR